MSDERRCTAHVSNGTRRCRAKAIRGGTVCNKHGGSAPQVKAAARRRLEAMVEPAIDALRKALADDDTWAMLKAAQMILDRAGYMKASRTEIVEEEARVAQIEQLFAEETGRNMGKIIEHVLATFGIDVREYEVRRALAQAIDAIARGEDPPPVTVKALPPKPPEDTDRMVL